MLYTIALIIHLAGAITFIGSVFFWTFILDTLKTKIDNFDEIESKLSVVIVPTMRVIVGIVLITGLYMFHVRAAGIDMDFFGSSYGNILLAKGILGLIMVIAFYIVSFNLNRIRHHDALHYVFITVQIVLIVLAKLL
ncbi:hypothetical protein [Helicobacter sp. 11S02629-2]|uniref:hypothetical protein n=1 Tax=Helicobacter sp. 11S02629-2 TaxID=1476195 RepID=UPI000BA70E3A|nr:hypothetical protein [Helicobacter sp. 11S02629-2]PAF45948.1 hypothetical protein BKH40_00615 [Helicobacter sp. 11S02629-2]